MISVESGRSFQLEYCIKYAEGCHSRTRVIGYINQLLNTRSLTSFIKVDIHQGIYHSEKIITAYTNKL